MSSMSYCRFQNALDDLRDCGDALIAMGGYEKELSEDEASAAKAVLRLCRELADDQSRDAGDFTAWFER